MNRYDLETALSKAIREIDSDIKGLLDALDAKTKADMEEIQCKFLTVITEYLEESVSKAHGFLLCSECKLVVPNPPKALISDACSLCKKETCSYISGEALQNKEYREVLTNMAVKSYPANSSSHFRDFIHKN